jgi:dihydroorotate dehydrogenase electron transfer subunit
MIFNEICEVIYNKEIAKNIFETKLFSDKISNATKPGQFINILPSISFENVMRRPMSLSDQDSESINIIYKAIGDGTRIMKSWREGEKIDIIGPLGNYWDINHNKELVLLAGGVGIAPILNLYNRIKDMRKTNLFIGARDRDEHFLKHN